MLIVSFIVGVLFAFWIISVAAGVATTTVHLSLFAAVLLSAFTVLQHGPGRLGRQT